MRAMKWTAVVVAALLVVASSGALAQTAPLSDQQVKARVEALLAQMTLEEKVGQATQIAGGLFPGAKPEEALRKGGAGSILWLNDTKKFNELQKVAVEESRLKIPVLYGLDVIHGYRTIFPVPLAMAASWDPSVHERAAAVAAMEARAAGIHWTFAPMLDIARDARWGRIVEGAGEDPYLGAAMAAAQVHGFQGPYLGAPDRLLACAKHFGAYGAADGGRDYDPVYVPEGRLRNVYFPPFQAAVKAGVGSFMSAYMDLNDVPAGGEPLAPHGRAAWRVGVQGLRGERRHGRREPRHHGLREGPWRSRPARPRRRPRHGDGERGLPRAPRPAREGGRRPDGAARRRRAPRPRGQGADGPLREALRRRDARRVRPRRPAAPRRGAPRRAALDGAAAERGQDAAALEVAHERRRDRPPRGLEGRHRGLVDGVRPRAGRGDGARGPQGQARRTRRSRTPPGRRSGGRCRLCSTS